MDKELQTTLRGIGFSPNEAAVYLAALELGPSSMWDIALKCGLQRSTCYSLMEELVIKGYASKDTDGKRALYAVTSPKRLMLAARTRYERFERSISELDALASKSTQKPIVRFYEGVEGVREVYLSCLDTPKGEPVLFMGNDAIATENYPDVIREYAELRQIRKVPIRVIFEDLPFNRENYPTNPGMLRECRFYPPEKFHLPIETQISGDRVMYISHNAQSPFAYVIENAAFADCERQKFELLWAAGNI